MSICTSNLTSGFIDLATYDEQEKYMYGGPDATAYFVRETRKSTWFTQVPVCLSKSSGSSDFGNQWSVSISRAGDYLLQTWLRVEIPQVTLLVTGNYTPGTRIRWTNNLMHALIKECCITFNDLVAARFDNYHLDFWSAFTVPAGKRNGYNNMVGNQLEGFNGQGAVTLPALVLNLPLPFFYTRDSGVALPTAAIPYNDMRIQFQFRRWEELLQLVNYNGEVSCITNANTLQIGSGGTVGAPSIANGCQVWANYAIVSNDERKRMACAPRDILIEQVQTAPLQNWCPCNMTTGSFDIRFSHAIKVLFFATLNNTFTCNWSNYTSLSPYAVDGTLYENGVIPVAGTNGTNILVFDDPIEKTSLIYENTQRLGDMTSDYYSLVNPWYNAPVIPTETGYHMYSYSLDFYCLDPMGSTNYGKLTNVTIQPKASSTAIYASSSGGSYPPSGWPWGQTVTLPENISVQKYQFVVTAINNNIVRISGGALGFPVL